MECLASTAQRFIGRLPFLEDGGGAARIDQLIGPHIEHPCKILAKVQRVDQIDPVAGPFPFFDDLIETEGLLVLRTRMVIVDAQSFGKEESVERRRRIRPCNPKGESNTCRKELKAQRFLDLWEKISHPYAAVSA